MKNKRILVSIFAVLMVATSLFAQRFGYVDTEYILRHIPEYSSAQKKLDEQAANWRKEVDEQYVSIDKMYKEYQTDQVLLTPSMKQKREKEIVDAEKKVKTFEREKFGYEGELFDLRQELVKPIQDKVYEAIEQVAKSGSLSFIFDKNSELIMLYANDRYDNSDKVIEELGYTPGNFADITETEESNK
ncbi:MAG: outer membrane protein [Sphingobacteriales bacterium]|jgi:outer membrane protein